MTTKGVKLLCSGLITKRPSRLIRQHSPEEVPPEGAVGQLIAWKIVYYFSKS